MKKIFTLTALAIASLLIATRSDAQVYVNARVGYPGAYGYAAPRVVYENEFPGYAYYDYPAWNGHYRDYYYYSHYRPFFERRYGGYGFRGGFNRGGYGGHFGGGYGGRFENHYGGGYGRGFGRGRR